MTSMPWGHDDVKLERDLKHLSMSFFSTCES
jgi:hypothetical protein